MNRWLRWLLYVVPSAALVIPESLHPNPHALGSVYQSVSPVVDWWIELHLLFVVFFTLLAFGLLVSLVGRRGVAATAARLAIGAFVAVANAFVGTEGIGMGLVIRGGQGLSAAQQAGIDQAVQSLWDGFTATTLGEAHASLWVLAIGLTAITFYPAARRPLPLALVGAAVLWMTVIGRFVSAEIWVAAIALLWVMIVAVVGMQDRAAIGPFGLLILAMLLPQHGEPGVSAVGAASVGAALLWRDVRIQPLSAGAARTVSPALARGK